MMHHCGLGNPLVEKKPNKILAGVHGGHVDHDLGVGSMCRGVQDAHISPGHCRHSKPAGGKQDLVMFMVIFMVIFMAIFMVMVYGDVST